MIGPLFLLKMKGTICPCLEEEADQMARQAAFSISNLPVRWHRKSSSSDTTNGSGSSGGGVGAFVSGLFGGNGKGIETFSWNGVWGKLSVVDTLHGPAIHVETTPNLANNAENDGEGDEQDIPEVQSQTITMRKISEALPADSFFASSRAGIILNGKRTGDGDRGAELLRFDIRVAADSDTDVESEMRDELMDKISVLLEWDRRRRSHGKEGNQEEEDEENNLENGDSGAEPRKRSNIISEKTAKMKHFAQREIEMQKKKRDREQRKARYMKESGGLKYTAVAMANRAIT